MLVHYPSGWSARTDPWLVALVGDVAKGRDVWLVQADRTIAEEQADIDNGVSHLKDPTHSLHVIVPGVRPLALAVDLAPALKSPKPTAHIGYVIPWDDHATFVDLGAFVKERAAVLGITPFSWGGDWPKPFDFDHFQKAPAPNAN